MNRIILKIFFALCYLIYSSLSISNENIYRIDYIIFKYLPDIASNEKFVAPEIKLSEELINITTLQYPEFKKPDSLVNNFPYHELFQDISVSRIVDSSNEENENKEEKVMMSKNQLFFQNDSGVDFSMEEIIQKLKRSKNYRVIGKNSWFQEVKNEVLAPSVFVQTKIDNGNMVFGEIKVYKKRFLHVDLNLYFGKESSDSVNLEKEIELKELGKNNEFKSTKLNLFENLNLNFLYQINHSRKVRSREVHYVDHPKFGVLFEINPITSN